MNHTRLVRGLTAIGAAAAAMATLAIASPAQAATTTAAQTATPAAGTVTAATVIKKYLKCSQPKNHRVNFSWGSGYNRTVTVYYYNHCSKTVKASIHVMWYDGTTGTKCVTTKAGKKDKKTFIVLSQIHGKALAYKVTRGC